MKVELSIANLSRVQSALKQSPDIVLGETRDFLVRAAAEVRRVIFNDPWRVGMSGGGVPVNTGNLRQSHRTSFFDWSAAIGPDTNQAPYAGKVHDGDRRRGIRARPWLVYAEGKAKPAVEALGRDMVRRITEAVARRA